MVVSTDHGPMHSCFFNSRRLTSSAMCVYRCGAHYSESLADCAHRAYSNKQCLIGSSDPACFGPVAGYTGAPFAEKMSLLDVPTCNGARWCGALMLSNKTQNPLAYGWNKLYIPYCDGGSFGGRNHTTTWTNWTGTLANGTILTNASVPLHFRGRVNLEAVVSDAIARHGLGSATDVVVGGDSAGGLATYWSADWWQKRLSPSTRFGVAPDSGMFINSSAPGGEVWRKNLGWIVSQMNSTSSLDSSCRAAHLSDPSACAFPNVVLPYISAPIFVMQGQVDGVMDDISGAGRTVTGRNIAKAEILASVKAAVAARPSQNAAFLTMCDEHCGQWGADQNVSALHPAAVADYNVTIDGLTGKEAVALWWNGLVGRNKSGGQQTAPSVAPRMWIQTATYPCATCCAGGNT